MTPLLGAILLLTARCRTPFRSVVEVAIEHGDFSPKVVKLTAKDQLKFTNRDATGYTVEGAGALPGDTYVPAGESRTVEPLPTTGRFHSSLEEQPSADLQIDLEGDADAAKANRPIPFEEARAHSRQPLLFTPGLEPEYAVFTAFDIVGTGEDAQQGIFKSLFALQQAFAWDMPLDEFAPYFTPGEWQAFRRSVSLTYALGPGAYDQKFGDRVLATRPESLRSLSSAGDLGVTKTGQRDVLVRIASDKHWFNLRAARLVWSILGNRITRRTMESGYSNPGGRSPLLGGFFDGTGNPSGPERDKAVFGEPGGNGTYLAFMKVVFDEERFRASSLDHQQQVIGREKVVGKPLDGARESAHKNRAGADRSIAILRQPFIFDEGVGRTGLLFQSLQASPKAVERILSLMLGPSDKNSPDDFLQYMKFESASIYYAPSSPAGSFPGSVESGGR